MKKFIRIILAILEIAAIAAVSLFYFVPSVNEMINPYFKYLIIAICALTCYWIIVICVSSYKKEIGFAIDGKIKFKKDKERKVETVDDVDSNDVYSNFERAEFTNKLKEDYQKTVIAFSGNKKKAPKKVAKPEVAPVIEEKPVKEEKKVEKPVKVKEEKKEVKPVKEVKKQEKPAEVKKEVKPVKKPSVRPTPIKVCKSKVLVMPGWKELFESNDAKLLDPAIKEVFATYDSGKLVYPAKERIFKAFELTNYDEVKVVIIGKLPYYRKNQADGLAYSTAAEADINQSTQVIINECVSDAKIKAPKNGSLEKWAEQGVFLLNTVLTAPSDKPAAHSDIWSPFTDKVIKELASSKQPMVFVLWGEHAKQYKDLVSKNNKHLVIESVNPSPLSATSGFYGSKPFSKINEFLKANGVEEIDWSL